MKVMIPFRLLKGEQLICGWCNRDVSQEEKVQIVIKGEGLILEEQTWTIENVLCNECAPIVCKEEEDIMVQDN